MIASDNVPYILGHSDAEIGRLQTQAAILRPITERLLRNAGIRLDMRILDLGTGAGDVAMLAAELVGPNGCVVGIDSNPTVVAKAGERARSAGLRHVVFQEGTAETFSDDTGFDLVVGRYVLIHQLDPVAFLQAAARLARPGASIAFHEPRLLDVCPSVPRVPLWETIDRLIRLAFSTALPNYDAGDRLIEHFRNAGLPEPSVFCETRIWTADAPHYAWMVHTLRSLLPQLRRIGVVADEFVGIDSLEARLRNAVLTARSQVAGPPQICAWVRT
jgi:ubiquinone/menaquinone biosynthesis C-methylase UbiE